MSGSAPSAPTIVGMFHRIRLAAPCLVATLTLAGMPGCGGSDAAQPVAGEPVSLEELSRSASTSAAAQSGRFSFGMTMSLPGAEEQFAFTGEGAFDTASDRASFSMDMSSLAKLLGGFVAGLAGPDAKDVPDFDDPSGWQIDAVQDGTVSYVRFPAVADRLPAGKSWIRTDGTTDVQGFDLDQFATSDPRTLLDVLNAASAEVETLGSEELHDVKTTHYRATIDPREYAKVTPTENREEFFSLVEQMGVQSGLVTIPVEVWLDSNGLVRKLSLEISSTRPGSPESGDASIAFELWDYGEDVEIALPPASLVVDASAIRS
jgi:hypothetical protein